MCSKGFFAISILLMQATMQLRVFSWAWLCWQAPTYRISQTLDLRPAAWPLKGPAKRRAQRVERKQGAARERGRACVQAGVQAFAGGHVAAVSPWNRAGIVQLGLHLLLLLLLLAPPSSRVALLLCSSIVAPVHVQPPTYRVLQCKHHVYQHAPCQLAS